MIHRNLYISKILPMNTRDEKKILRWSREVDRLVDSLSFKFEIFEGRIKLILTR